MAPQEENGHVYYLVRASSFLLRLVPLRLAYAAARALGLLAYVAWAGGRRRAIDNMRRVTGGDEPLARAYARRSFQNYAVYLVDFLRFLYQDQASIQRRVVFDRWEELEAQRTGNGIVFMTMHFGNWDLGAAILALKGFPISAIADSFANHRLDRLVVGSREHLGMRVISAGRTGPDVLRALRRNNVVAMLVDIPQHSGVRVTFFGHTIAVPDGPARIALRAGASVVAAALPRIHPWDDRVRAEVAAVPFTPSGDPDRDVQGLTQAVFTQLEQFVRRDPSQWYIFRRLWLPEDERQIA